MFMYPKKTPFFTFFYSQKKRLQKYKISLKNAF